MNRPRKLLFRTLAVISILIVIELFAGYWITHIASPTQFDRFASFKQYTARYGDPGFSPHRFTGYFGTPNWVNGSDRHNTLGYRGEETSVNKPEGLFRIVCLGSSATYSMGVKDYHYSYPYLLQEELRSRGYTQVEVINAGIDEYTTWESLLELQFLVLDLSPDLIIIYPSPDDISARLVWPPSAYHGDNSGEVTAPYIPKPSFLAYSNTLRIGMISLGWLQPVASPSQIWSPRTDTAFDQLFADQWVAGTYPQGFFREVSADEMLAQNSSFYFEQNIRSMISTAWANGIEVVLATVASSPQFPENPQAASPQYQSALIEQNQILEVVAASVSNDKDVHLFDFATILSSEDSYFINGIVFTAEGNQLAAEQFANFLIENELIPP